MDRKFFCLADNVCLLWIDCKALVELYCPQQHAKSSQLYSFGKQRFEATIAKKVVIEGKQRS